MKDFAKFSLIVVALSLMFVDHPNYLSCAALTVVALVMWVIDR